MERQGRKDTGNRDRLRDTAWALGSGHTDRQHRLGRREKWDLLLLPGDAGAFLQLLWSQHRWRWQGTSLLGTLLSEDTRAGLCPDSHTPAVSRGTPV